jgi:hypothetical protein
MGAIQQLMLGKVTTAFIFSTWNPLDMTSAITLSNGNLTLTMTATANQGIRGTLSRSSGKFYFEYTQGAAATNSVGIADATHVLTTGLGLDNVSSGYSTAGVIYYNTTLSVFVATYTTGDVIGVAVNITNGLIYYAKNGIWQNGANPSLGLGGLAYVTAAAVFPAWGTPTANVTSGTVNVGAKAFSYTPPTGFSSWD